MRCSELDQFLFPYLDGEFASVERLEFEEHLASCPTCTQKVQQQRVFRDAFRLRAQEAAQAHRPSPALRDNVRMGFRREHRRAQQTTWMRAGAAALIAVAAGGIYVQFRTPPRQKYFEEAALWHSKGLPFEIQQQEQARVEAWFDGKLDHRVTVPRLRNATVAGARLSKAKDRPAAYISYQAAPSSSSSAPRRVGLFVFDDSRGELGAQPLPKIQMGSSRGYNVALWRDGEIVYELVSDLDEADIRGMLADAVRSPIRQQVPVGVEVPLPVAAPTVPTVPIRPAALQQ